MGAEQQALLGSTRSDPQILAWNVAVALERWKLKQIMENLGTFNYKFCLFTVHEHIFNDFFFHSNRSNSATHADYGKMAKAITCSSNSTSYGSSGHVMTAPQNNNNNNTIISGGNTSNNNGSNGPFKPVPPPKPKNYRPPLQNSSNSNTTALKPPQTWEHTVNASVKISLFYSYN